MKRAEEVVFIGYSFPDYDQRPREFFTDNVRDKNIVVIDPSPDTQKKFKCVFGAEAAKIVPLQNYFVDCLFAQPPTDT